MELLKRGSKENSIRIAQSLTGGVLLSLAWWEYSTGIIMFFALVPFIAIFHSQKQNRSGKSSVFIYVLPGFLLFNIFTFSWLTKASIAGGSLTILTHSFLMSMVFWLAHQVHRRSNNFTGYLSLIVFWLTYEHLCLNLNIISPWLNIGNVFGKEPALIQWYEYTGSGGGSLWVLLVSILMYASYRYYRSERKIISGYLTAAFLIFIIPVTYSVIRYHTYREEGEECSVIIVQPNIDPYNEKFGKQGFTSQLTKMFEQANSFSTNNYNWLILPETVVDDPFFEANARTNRYIALADSFVSKNIKTNLVLGMTTIDTFSNKEEKEENSVIEIDGTSLKYEIYNSAIFIAAGQKPQFYHKSKLVPGIERKVNILPAPLEKIIISNLGGTVSGYGTQTDRSVFNHSEGGSIAGSAICYESAYGEFTTGYINNGANIIFIITNDGWWDNTAGYKQHLWFASLRAIENRTPVARSANTGISCLIDQRGHIIKKSTWWRKEVITGNLVLRNKLTFYARYGDMIYKYSDILSVITLILIFIARPLRKLRVNSIL